MKYFAALVSAAVALSSAHAAHQPPAKAPPATAAPKPPPPPPKGPKITEADRKELMSLVDVLEVASLVSIGDWEAEYVKKKSRPLSNTAAAKAVLEQNNPKQRGPNGIRRGDVGEYELVRKHHESIEKVFANAATLRAPSNEPVGYGDEAFRFASDEGKTVGILVTSSNKRYDESKQGDVSRASKAANDLILPIAGALAEFSKPDAPPFLGIIVTYGLQSTDDPNSVKAMGESVALIWDAKSVADFKAGTLSRKMFLHKAKAYLTDKSDFGMKTFDIKL